MGGGESISGGSAKSANITFSLENVKGNEYEGTTYYGGYILVSETDDEASKKLAESQQAIMTVTNSKAEFLWGGLLLKSEALSSNAKSDLVIKDSTSVFHGIAHFDALSVSHPITVSSFEPKSDGVPTLLKVSGLSAGDTAVTFQGSGAKENWFTLRNGRLNYNQTESSAVWSIASYNQSSGSIAVQHPSEAPAIALENNNADRLLTEEDREKMNTRSSVEIILKSDPVSAPPDDISKLLKKEMERTQTQPAVILDINLMKVIDALDNLSTEPDKVTIETDRFSFYTLVYKDLQNPGTAATASASATESTSSGGHSQTSDGKNTSGSRKTAIGKRSVSQKASSKKSSSGSDSKSGGSGFLGSIARTADSSWNISSLLLILSGSVICAGFLKKNR